MSVLMCQLCQFITHGHFHLLPYQWQNIEVPGNCKPSGNPQHTVLQPHLLFPPGFRFIAAVVDQFQFRLHLTANLRDLLLLFFPRFYTITASSRNQDRPFYYHPHSPMPPHHPFVKSVVSFAVHQTESQAAAINVSENDPPGLLKALNKF